ncbi:MAG: protein phosphatase CheZ, partial [Nitrospirae bacterium]|nr:protein phosphatase CheZ [Nitrospirota bacterium]
ILIQEYQDLTGQIIKKVIDLTTTLEKELKNLIELFGKKTEKQKKEVFENQGDVDDLLKEFGL